MKLKVNININAAHRQHSKHTVPSQQFKLLHHCNIPTNHCSSLASWLSNHSLRCISFSFFLRKSRSRRMPASPRWIPSHSYVSTNRASLSSQKRFKSALTTKMMGSDMSWSCGLGNMEEKAIIARGAAVLNSSRESFLDAIFEERGYCPLGVAQPGPWFVFHYCIEYMVDISVYGISPYQPLETWN